MSAIEHLSPSSLALFKASPALWVGKYLSGWKDEMGPQAWRGSAVEAGLDALLCAPPGIPSAGDRAGMRFEDDAQGDMSEAVDKQRKLIPEFLNQAHVATQQLPLPVGRQFKIELWLDGIGLPIHGYLDYLYESFLFDLKTTERMPSEPKSDHVMQCSIYAEAKKRPARLLYVTPKKFQWFDITPEMQKNGMDEAKRLAGNIESMLRMSSNPKTLLSMFPLDFDNFRWSDSLKQLALTAIKEK